MGGAAAEKTKRQRDRPFVRSHRGLTHSTWSIFSLFVSGRWLEHSIRLIVHIYKEKEMPWFRRGLGGGHSG